MKIVVLCGGLSMERDVSISSGTGAARALRERGHQVVLLDLFLGWPGLSVEPADVFDNPPEIQSFSVGETAPDLDQVRAMRPDSGASHIGPNVLALCAAADITFLALHGEEGENGAVQATLDLHGIRYTGCGCLGSAIAMNKSVTKALLERGGLTTPGGITLTKGGEIRSLGFPCVVKPCSGGSSVGTSIVQREEEYVPALDLAFQYERHVLVEPYIKGRELTVGVMDGKAMPVIEIIPKSGFYDYKNKYQAGATLELCPAPIGDEATRRIQDLAERVNALLDIEAYCRVDFLWDEEKDVFYCLEANTLPGMTPTSLIPQMALTMGWTYGGLCEKIIEVSLKKYEKSDDP